MRIYSAFLKDLEQLHQQPKQQGWAVALILREQDGKASTFLTTQPSTTRAEAIATACEVALDEYPGTTIASITALEV